MKQIKLRNAEEIMICHAKEVEHLRLKVELLEVVLEEELTQKEELKENITILTMQL